MAYDAYIQIAPDSTGKKLATDQQTDASGSTVQVQKALLVGDPADALVQLLEINQQQLAVLRAILRVFVETTNARVLEEDFSSQRGANFDV
jgi:hypothetical protein